MGLVEAGLQFERKGLRGRRRVPGDYQAYCIEHWPELRRDREQVSRPLRRRPHRNEGLSDLADLASRQALILEQVPGGRDRDYPAR